MNAYLIHGENSLGARNRFIALINSYKSRGWEVSKSLISDSLFSDKVLLVLENPKTFPKEAIGKEIIILCDGNASAALVKTLPKEIKIEKFDLPKKLFAFLDSVYPKNAKNVLRLMRELTESEPVELVFTMLGRQVRDMYWVLEDKDSLKLPPWRVGKLNAQASKFGKSKLKKLIKLFAEIDGKAKSGQVDLVTSLDLFVASELE